ncbi:restriction endonuclease subunit S [Clostridium sp.]|uniref:restriction endonuclease subunit S n=1 Tax=Clostridium sp. TaxID=1506 RepID=UPI0029096861|nr:restriction endonuclease subunit S [Clostridium sp.]MDU4736905.1 restriction endonuclease subunit S [Clostridium sp.]MDU7364453.1 restriction endonuclease subunit S [Clostridium sp.]
MEYVKLRNYIELISGRDLTKAQYNDKNNGIPYIMGASNMTNGKLNIERWTNEPTVIGLKDDLIISVKGTVGELLILEEEKVHLSRQVMAIRPKEGYDVKFVFYYMKYYLDRLKEKAKGMIPGVTREDILDAEFIEVSSEDQQRIIKILNKAQELINKRKEQIEALDELVKSQFIEMFGDPYLNNKGFIVETINDVCSSIVRGPFGSALKKEFFVEPGNDTYKVYEQKHAIQKKYDIGEYYVSKDKYEELKRFECGAGDILMSCSGTMGELYQLPDECEKGIINQALCKFTLNDKILPIMFLMYMKQTIGNLETKGSGIKNIASVAYVKSMPVMIPPMELQDQFADFVKQVDKLKFEMEESLKELENNFNSLMQRAFNGELLN